MPIYDITVPLGALIPVYPGDCPVLLTPWSRIANGDEANVSQLSLCTHSGTHLDPPRHFDDQGITVDEVPLEVLLGPARVVAVPGRKVINAADLEALALAGVERLLFKTDNSRLWGSDGFSPDFTALSPDAARYLVALGVRLVGIDYLSVEGMDGDGSVHHTLLENGVLILEGLNLVEVEPGEYELICLPLKLAGGDGAPVRAVLRNI